MLFHVGLICFLDIESDDHDPFIIFVFQVKLRIVTAIKIILFLTFSNNSVIRIMFFHIFPLLFQKLIQIFLIKNSRICNGRDILVFFLLLRRNVLLLSVWLVGLLFLCFNLADGPQRAGNGYSKYL